MNQSDVSDIVYKVVVASLPSEILPERFTILSGDIPNDDTQIPGLILSHVPGPWAITTLGGNGVCRRRLRTGNVFLQVRTPIGYGQDQLGIAIAEQLGNLFEGRWQDLPLKYTGVDIRAQGRSDAWYLCNCVLTYEFDNVA